MVRTLSQKHLSLPCGKDDVVSTLSQQHLSLRCCKYDVVSTLAQQHLSLRCAKDAVTVASIIMIAFWCCKDAVTVWHNWENMGDPRNKFVPSGNHDLFINFRTRSYPPNETKLLGGWPIFHQLSNITMWSVCYQSRVKDLLLLDVTPLSMGIEE